MQITCAGRGKLKVCFLYHAPIGFFHTKHLFCKEAAPSSTHTTNIGTHTHCMHTKFLEYLYTIVLLLHQHHTSDGVPFHVNSIKTILKMCLGHPETASRVSRYPVIPQDCAQYVGWKKGHCLIVWHVAYTCTSSLRELFHGHRWHNDLRFYSPMVATPSGSVFIYDFVSFHVGGEDLLGHVLHLFCKVSQCVCTCTCTYTCISGYVCKCAVTLRYFHRKVLMVCMQRFSAYALMDVIYKFWVLPWNLQLLILISLFLHLK